MSLPFLSIDVFPCHSVNFSQFLTWTSVFWITTLAGDIEGHLGYDQRYYVLDFARTFPAEARLAGDPAEPVPFNSNSNVKRNLNRILTRIRFWNQFLTLILVLSNPQPKILILSHLFFLTLLLWPPSHRSISISFAGFSFVFLEWP